MTSQLTGATLTAQQHSDRWKQYHLAISRPNTIMTALINGTPASLDGVTELTYDNATGTYTDVLPGMACWVSAVGFGAFDLGIVRVRKALTDTIAYINKTSGIQFANNYYLTFVDDFGLWNKEPLSTDTLTLIDQDVAFNSVQSFASMVKIGPPALVLTLTGATVAHTRPAPTSYSPLGATAASYVWTAAGCGVVVTNETTSTPTFTYNTPGEAYERLAFTDSIGAITYVTRKVFINPPTAIFVPKDISGDVDSGGWSCSFDAHTGSSALDYKTSTVSRARASNVATLNLQHPHGLISGDTVNVRDMTDSTYNAEGAIVTVTDSDSLTYANTGDNEGTTADTAGFIQAVSLVNLVDVSEMHDRALCVLWKSDFVGTATDTACGPYAEGKNIRLVGRLGGDEPLTITDQQYGTAEFTIYGPAYWLDKINGSPMALTDISAGAGNWNEISTMDTDKALYRFIKHQTTLADITDVTLSGDTTRIKSAIVNSGSLRQQIDGMATEKILARLACDRFGCVFIQIPPGLRSAAGKAALDVLWDSSSSDWTEQLNIERRTVSDSGMMEISGSSYDGTTEVSLFSRAPGNTNDQYGSPQSPYTALAVDTQAILNRIAGDVLAVEKSEYPSNDIVLHWANDFVDIAPCYIITVDVAATDTPRGIAWTNKRLFPESVAYEFDVDTGAEGTALTLAEETTGIDGVDYFPPRPGDDNFTPLIIDFPPGVPTTTTWFPPTVSPPPVTDGCGADAPLNTFTISFAPTGLDGLSSTLSSFCWFPCKLRPASATNGNSYLRIHIYYFGDALGNVSCYGVDSSKTRVITGTVTPPSSGDAGNFVWTRIDFTPISEQDVAGFEILLAAGGSVERYEAKDIISGGTVAATNETGEIVPDMVTGNYYGIEGTGGPWKRGEGFPNTQYDFQINGDGQIGWSATTFVLDTPTSCVASERVASLYGRTFLQKGAGDITFRVADTVFGDNTGSLGWTLRSATAIGTRRVTIADAALYQVCAAG